MSRTRKIVLAIVVVVVTSPAWAFELAYHALLPPETPVLPATTRATPLELDTLWAAAGESKDHVTWLWAGNLFRHPSGAHAAGQVAVAWRRQKHLRSGRRHRWEVTAQVVWLSRNASADMVKRGLAEWLYFGRHAFGIDNAARAYFGCAAPPPTLAQSALLAVLALDPSGYDPIRVPKINARARHELLEKIAAAGKISAEQLAHADAEPIDVLPKAPNCD